VENTEDMTLPYVFGFNYVDAPIITDLAKYSALLIGGTGTSGKTTALLALLICLAYNCSPEKLRILIIDVGATDLVAAGFNKLPHLLHPVIDDADLAINALLTVNEIITKRLKLKRENPTAFNKLPRYVVVAEELLVLIASSGSKKKYLVSMLQKMLQHSRHANVHIIISALDPTKACLNGISLAPVDTRIAFRCSKSENSRTILGETGAEKLSGNGELLLKSNKFSELQRLKGSFIDKSDVPAVVEQIREKYDGDYGDHDFVIRDFNELVGDGTTEGIVYNKTAEKTEINNKQIAKTILWALKNDSISTNRIKKSFKMGWNKAEDITNKLHDLGIISDLDATNSRSILPGKFEDLASDAVVFLENNGYSQEDIDAAFACRK